MESTKELDDLDCIDKKYIHNYQDPQVQNIIGLFTCQICLQVSLNIRVCSKCSQPYGLKCLKEYLQKQKKCPNCRNDLITGQNQDQNLNQFKNRLVSQLMSNTIKLQCRNVEKGCKQLIQFDHDFYLEFPYDEDCMSCKDCIWEIISMFNINLEYMQQQQCDWQGQTNGLVDHQKDCPYKMVKCDMSSCQWQGNYMFKFFHEEKFCMYVHRECPNQNCNKLFSMIDMANHLDECEFK